MRLKIILSLLFLMFFIVSLTEAENFSVLIKESAIRESPKFFAPIKIMVKYGDILDVFETEGDWYKVKFRNIIGYIHKTAIEKREVTTKGFSSTKGYSASEAEITLAGKGFNPQVERAYKNKYPEMKFYLVDRIERYDVSDYELIYFIKNGGLLEPK